MISFAAKHRDFYLSALILCAGLFALLLHEAQVMTDLAWSVVFVVSMLLTGIPHGALDHLVEKRHAELNGARFKLSIFLMNYLGRMGIYGLVWLISPTLGLIIFLVLSGWHFGETDLQYISSKNKEIDRTMATIYGLFVLAVLLLNNTIEAAAILAFFPSPGWDTALLGLESSAKILIQAGLGLLFLAFFIPQAIIHKSDIASYAYVLFGLLVLIFLLVQLPLLIGFTVYFAWWHSMRTLHRISLFLEKEASHRVSLRHLAMQAIPFSLMAFIGIAGLIWWGGYSGQMSLVLVGLFIGIALLTAPHLEVMGKLFRYPAQPVNDDHQSI